MRPSTGIFSHLYESYKQNKAILAIIGKIQQPVLHDGKKIRFKKKYTNLTKKTRSWPRKKKANKILTKQKRKKTRIRPRKKNKY